MAKLRINPISVAYHLIKNDVHELEYNHAIQLKINIVMARFWVFSFFAVLIIYFFANPWWQHFSILYLALVSIYDSWVGHYSAIPACYAAVQATKLHAQQNPIEEFRY